ncbi:MAG: hypothetical protein ACT4PE_16435 [Candidatus Eiseniibacteriota bacterium]
MMVTSDQADALERRTTSRGHGVNRAGLSTLGGRFFEHRAALKWQRLWPYEKFVAMIDRHWDGIAAYCDPDNKVALGFVEG